MHIPVLKNEVVKYLDVKPNENFIDCTLGEAGHARAILEKNKPNGKVLGIEIESELFKKDAEIAKEYNGRLIVVNDSYANLKKIAEEHNFLKVNGILMDLGMSSWHIDESQKGFSFLKNEPLNMKFGPPSPRLRKGEAQKYSAEGIINEYEESELEAILKEYGEERFARRIAKEIVNSRPIKTTFDLVKAIERSIPLKFQRAKTHPATRVFQAIRIAVNDELNNLKITLPQAFEILEKGGRLVIISFHSLEDRIVKNYFKEVDAEILTKKPVSATLEEIRNNPRARSAKLRAIKKL